MTSPRPASSPRRPARGLAAALLGALGAIAATAGAAAAPAPVLTLERSVPIPGIVTGDFDHFAVDAKRGLLYTSAQSAHVIATFDLATGAYRRAVPASVNPHYIFFAPAIDRIILADGGATVQEAGQIKLLDPATMAVTKAFPTRYRTDSDYFDADRQLFYSVSADKDGKDSLMTVIDLARQAIVATAPIASANVEGMALDPADHRLFLNLRDARAIGVFDTRANRLVAQWPIPGMTKNTPMAADPASHRLFVIGRDPGRLYVIDSRSGRLVSTADCVNGGDDVQYDAAHRRLFVTGEDGFTVLARRDADHFEAVQSGGGKGGKSAIYVPAHHLFFVGRPGSGDQPSLLDVYRVRD